jgi:hypothetical protein
MQYKIFLSNVKDEKLRESLRLPITLNRAGFVFEDSQPATEQIADSSCAVQIIGKSYQRTGNNSSLSEEHFNEIKKRVEKDENYKGFIWLPGNIDYSDADKEQLDFINRLQFQLSNNMVLSRAPSAVQFVEDVRIILEQLPTKTYETHPTDVFLICNQVDEKEAMVVQKMLSDIIQMVKLTIVQDSDLDYEEFAAQQMSVSKLSVVYFNKGADWAIPFSQQIWKKIGGASATVTMLLIGDSNNPANAGKKFTAPRVTSALTPNDLIPLEIKVQFDTVNNRI